MTMAMISPSGREVSPAEQLRQSPRLIPPRFRLVAAEFRLRRWVMIFFPHRKTAYSRRWPPEGYQGAHKVGGRAQWGRACPHPRGKGVAPLVKFLLSVFFIYLENIFCEVSGLLELCRIGL